MALEFKSIAQDGSKIIFAEIDDGVSALSSDSENIEKPAVDTPDLELTPTGAIRTLDAWARTCCDETERYQMPKPERPAKGSMKASEYTKVLKAFGRQCAEAEAHNNSVTARRIQHADRIVSGLQVLTGLKAYEERGFTLPEVYGASTGVAYFASVAARNVELQNISIPTRNYPQAKALRESSL